MQLLSQITIPTGEKDAVIQLLLGDLSAIPKEHAVDILVVSAFPNNYIALKGSLFLALQNKGLSVQALAAYKEMDLVAQLGCWLSAPLLTAQKKLFNFKRILCFEPQFQSTEPQTIVGNIFRCINTFAFDEENDEIAMPVLATGYQKIPIQKMLPALLENAVFWLQNGLPLKCIKLVLYRQEQATVGLPIFVSFKQAVEKLPQTKERFISPLSPASPASTPSTARDTEPTFNPRQLQNKNDALKQEEIITGPQQRSPYPQPPVTLKETYDFFISYSHKQSNEVQEFVRALLEKQSKLTIFYDRSSIPPGGLWLRKISEALQNSKSVICILTPEYSKSDVCWDEFQCAKVMELRTRRSIIKTINFVTDAEMPPIFAIYNYIDCTEADLQKLKSSVNQFC